MKLCVGQQSSPDLEKATREFLPSALADPDSENRYWDATVLASCGQNEGAKRLLKSAIEGQYCAYTALESDRLLVALRGTPEFSQLLSAAKKCQDNFLSERAQASP